MSQVSKVRRDAARWRATVLILGVAFVALIASGCGVTSSNSGGGSSSSTQAASGSATSQGSGALVGFSLPTEAVARSPHEGAWFKQMVQKLGGKAIVDYANGSSTTQTDQVQSMFQQGIKVLVLDPIDSTNAGLLVKQAQARHIPVITYDVQVSGATPDWWIGRNAVTLGDLHVNAAVKAKPCGDYAIIRGDPGDSNEKLIGTDYKKVLNKPCIKVVYDTTTPAWGTAAALTEAEAALQKDPNLSAIVCMWDNCAQEAAVALKAAGKKPGQVYVTGTDASQQSLPLIAAGWQGMSGWTPIQQMANSAAKIAVAMAAGKASPIKPTKVVNGENFLELAPLPVDKANLCSFVKNVAPAGWVSLKQLNAAGARC